MRAPGENQVSVLASLYYACAVFFGLGSFLLLFGVVMHMLEASGPGRAAQSGDGWISGSPGLTAIGFVLAALWTAVLTRAARSLETRRHRVFCMAIAAICSLLSPLGTALGVVTIVTLMRPDVMRLFDGAGGNDPPDGIDASSLRTPTSAP
jgi:CDP-diglyceride synthetase